MTARPATDEENAAYRAGLCIRCREKPYSAGRPRCDTCHAEWQKTGREDPK